MKNALDKGATIKSVEKQMEENLDFMKKSYEIQHKNTVLAMQNRITTLEATQRKADIPPNFLVKPLAKSFDDHLGEWYPGIPAKKALEMHYEQANASLFATKFGDGPQPATHQMQKSMNEFVHFQSTKASYSRKYDDLLKSFGTSEYETLQKSFLGGAGDPGAPGAWFSFLEENLSRYIQRIILENADTTALQAIPTSITSNIIPELGRLKSSGVGFGKHTMGLSIEGGTFQFGGGQLMDRLTNNLVQRGIKASVTELLLGNKQKLIDRNPLELERELRVLEFNLGMNHNLLYGNDQIHKTGSTINEVAGFEQQITDATTGFPAHIMDWDNVALTATGVGNPLNIFRQVAENLVVNGHIPGGAITGRYSVLVDYGVSNNISTVVDDKQRLMLDKYENAAIYYGQQFTGFVTDLGTFQFKRSKTLDLTAGDTWTLDDDVPPTAIISTLAGATLSAIPQATGGEKAAAGFPSKADLPTGNYTYRVSVVNDQAESNVSASFVTTTNGTTPAAVASTQSVQISIPFESEFSGGVVAGVTVTPARYFLIYRGNAGQTTDAEMSCIAKVPINGTSTTTYVDWNQRIPGTAPMFFIPNDPMDLAHCSLTPTYEVPFYDPILGTTRQWQIMNIGGLCMWAPVRCYLVNNVPRFPKVL